MTRGDFKASLNTPVLSYFDVAKVKNVDERKRRMTLKDVLTMTTGLEWNEQSPYADPRSDSSLMEATDDWVQYVIDKPMAKVPGMVFNYSSGASELLAHIFKKETGQDIEAYGEKHLFAPLGIKHHWKRTYLGVVDTEVACTSPARIRRKSATSTCTTVCGAASGSYPRSGQAIADTVY